VRLGLLIRRSLAYCLDILLLFLVLAPLAFLLEWAFGLRPESGFQIWLAAVLSFSLPVWAYFTLSDASRSGATLGKKILRLAVVCEGESTRVTPTRALARTAVKLLPWEAAHIFGFALAGAVSDVVQVSGLVAANVLVLVYFGMAAATGGRRSVHD
jgi:uncharacterized RDD family membrane protein YckC